MRNPAIAEVMVHNYATVCSKRSTREPVALCTIEAVLVSSLGLVALWRLNGELLIAAVAWTVVASH